MAVDAAAAATAADASAIVKIQTVFLACWQTRNLNLFLDFDIIKPQNSASNIKMVSILLKTKTLPEAAC